MTLLVARAQGRVNMRATLAPSFTVFLGLVQQIKGAGAWSQFNHLRTSGHHWLSMISVQY